MSIIKKLTLEEEMLQYLQKKYGKEEPFKILGTNCQSMFSKSQESKALSERFPNEVITIIKYKKNGKFHIEDNFVVICRKAEISLAYADLIKGIYPKYTVEVHSLNPVVIVLPADIDMDTPADQIIKHKELEGAIIYIKVEDDVNKKEERLKALKELVLKTIHKLSVNISYYRNVHDLDTRYLSGYARINKELELSEIDWKNK